MLHKEFWGLLFLGFVFWILVASTPQSRIQHGCRPVGWTGNVVTSLSALVLPAQQQRVQTWFDKLEYGCQYMVWRLFYQDAYNAWKRTSEVTPPAIEPVIAPDKTPPPVDGESAPAPARASSAPSSPASVPALVAPAE